LALTGCGDDESACTPACDESQLCDPDTGLCVDPTTPPTLEKTNLSPQFDAHPGAEGLSLLLFDRTASRFLFGHAANEDLSEVRWEEVARAEGTSPLWLPRTRLLAAAPGAVALLETEPGVVSAAFRLEPDHWLLLPAIVVLDGPLALLDALYAAASGFTICAGNAHGELYFAAGEADHVSLPSPITLGEGQGGARVPAMLARFAGRTTVVAAAGSQGLVSLSPSGEGPWAVTPIDPEARPAAVAGLQAGDGFLTFYLDQNTGGLKVASGESDTLQIATIAAGVFQPGDCSEHAPCRIALLGSPSVEAPLAAFFHHGKQSVELLALDPVADDWAPVASIARGAPFVPALGVSTTGDPMAAGLVPPPAGQTGRGLLEILMF
jgi:hypothetical protein